LPDYHSLKKCDFCGENIPFEAGRCPYCGSILEATFNNGSEIEPNHSAYDAVNGDKIDQSAEPQPGSANERVYDADQANTDSQGAGEPQANADRGAGAMPQQNGWQTPPYGPSNGWQPQPYRPVTGSPNNVNGMSPLSNGMKVFLTVLFTLIPGIGQIAGIITAIVFMNSTDQDRKSFGVAILVASLIFFALSCIGCFILSIAASNALPSIY